MTFTNCFTAKEISNKLKSTTKQDELAALYDSAENEPLFYIKELRIPVE
jgi:hypothetical protein